MFLIICLGLGGALYVSVQNLSMTFVESAAPWKCTSCKCMEKAEPETFERDGCHENSSFVLIHYDLTTLCKSELNSSDFQWVNRNHTALSDYNQVCNRKKPIAAAIASHYSNNRYCLEPQ